MGQAFSIFVALMFRKVMGLRYVVWDICFIKQELKAFRKSLLKKSASTLGFAANARIFMARFFWATVQTKIREVEITLLK